MAVRTIIASQPELGCYVCRRILLRGERPEIFTAGGERRTVCELCAPRALQAGWPRATDIELQSEPAPAPRRGRTMFDRRRPLRRRAGREGLSPTGEPPAGDRSSHGYDTGVGGLAAIEGAVALRGAFARGDARSDPLARAAAVFNASEHPRRIAGLARSLGPPCVNIAAVEGVPGVVAIVVAWELCWYRYRVDLDQLPPQALVVGHGTETAELAREERIANAVADATGALTGPASQPRDDHPIALWQAD